MNPNRAIESPCVRNCCLDQHNICLGCFRALEEIMRWSQADDTERAAILANTRRRRALSLASKDNRPGLD
ncbi:Predicted Fe-S protein YdhL, DUF1289 family [Methylomagnum ishizawai]|uniref:Predicted Fe-S protein YdhL, DUF1289 family n=1 Tax=Methylomagnum ishizawai TaxID=1760988 RepID=A0A1Y6CY87_9GAMM|nr:DUF1289 domain-containing protein [Methylomagnum ishizawai]SMF95200.1 Predicted Fe-S protein YdhL, DUF1289 family [Methylomagnum ishizawai]